MEARPGVTIRNRDITKQYLTNKSMDYKRYKQ
ncbi:hypothetical protein GASC598B02_005850 [Gilliamella apicola SCGC AB-598-B02]|nr:hypothetical protein GASC598B02_005850 [Gilliamella apicola SCGC AB-598-B02]